MVAGLTGGVTRNQRREWKRRVRRNHFEELGELTGCRTGKISELKVLDRGGFSLSSRGVLWVEYLVRSQPWRN